MITAAQCRAARGLLKWKQKELAARTGIGVLAINKFEGGKTSPHHTTLKVIRDTFEAAGVEFLTRDGQGVGVQFGAGGGAG